VASPLKPLHFVGDWGHFRYRPILAQPSHTMRATSVDMEKVRDGAPGAEGAQRSMEAPTSRPMP
jgi:hypothetical protein